MFTRPSSAAYLVVLLTLLYYATPTDAFGAGYVARGSHLRATKFRHGDISLAIPLFAIANRRLVKQIYFGNWLRDFSQVVDKGSLALVPYPVLRALVAVFAFVQFGYATREFEVTDERLGSYRPEEHVDNPKGYDAGIPADPNAPSITDQDGVKTGYRISDGLRPAIDPKELDVDLKSGMKNYIANSPEVGAVNHTSADFIEKQLIAAITCGRQGDEEAYIHLGAALHTLEDFVAHSNYVELAMQLIGQDIEQEANMTSALTKVFAYVGGSAHIETSRGQAPPIVTGTFGALDLFQTLLGEIEDKMNAMSLPGLSLRASGDGGALQSVAQYLIGLLAGLSPDFEKDILSVQKAASKSKPTSWGELENSPELLWKSLEPVFKLRDDVVKWIHDHLTVRPVQDAIAAISTAIDKLVYMVLGIFLTPLLSEISKALKVQEEDLLQKDQQARLATGEQSIFDSDSLADNPTHSQLCKDHYDDVLNEVAGRVAVRISTHAVDTVIQLWQPGNTDDPMPGVRSILDTFHHPFNRVSNSVVQTFMFQEVREWVNESLQSDPTGFEAQLQSLQVDAVASHINENARVPVGNSARPHLHEHTTMLGQAKDEEGALTGRLHCNIEEQVKQGKVKDIGVDDLPMIKEMLLSKPSGENPSPLDSALSKLPGISFISTFQGINISEIAAANGMGETLKDAVVTMILTDEKRGMEEEDLAAGRYRWHGDESKEGEKARLKEKRALLEINKMDTKQEGQFDEKKSSVDRMKEGFSKLKLKASNKSG